jgi:hypothetical protein
MILTPFHFGCLGKRNENTVVWHYLSMAVFPQVPPSLARNWLNGASKNRKETASGDLSYMWQMWGGHI